MRVGDPRGVSPTPTPVCRLGLHSRPAGSPAPPTLETNKRFNREILLCPQCPQPAFCLSLPSATMTGLCQHAWPALLSPQKAVSMADAVAGGCLLVRWGGSFSSQEGTGLRPPFLQDTAPLSFPFLHTPTPLTFLPDGAWGTIYRFRFSD